MCRHSTVPVLPAHAMLCLSQFCPSGLMLHAVREALPCPALPCPALPRGPSHILIPPALQIQFSASAPVLPFQLSQSSEQSTFIASHCCQPTLTTQGCHSSQLTISCQHNSRQKGGLVWWCRHPVGPRRGWLDPYLGGVQQAQNPQLYPCWHAYGPGPGW